KQVLAVVRVEEASKRLYPADDEEDFILIAKRENRINKVVPSPLFAKLHLQALGKEVEHVACCLPALVPGRSRRAWRIECPSSTRFSCGFCRLGWLSADKRHRLLPGGDQLGINPTIVCDNRPEMGP